MGIVDISSLHRCGVRMNGVLIEWNSWLGYFYIFSLFLHVRTCHTIQKTIFTKKAVSHFTIVLWGYINLDKTGQKKE